jgi:flagellin
MALTILNNIAAIAAENQLNITSSSLNSTLEQLSSGSRINSGADDPAGLAIANGLQANVAALTQSSSNATDGVGELQVADGALSQVTTLLDRAVTLATESATGTVSDPQRIALDTEYQSIKAEIDSIGSTTNFNGGQVFTNNTLNVFLSDGSTSGSSQIGVSTGLLSSTSLTLGGTPATATLGEAVASSANAATDVLTGGTFVGSTQAASLLTASAQFNALSGATATLTGGAFTQGAQATGTITSNGTAPGDGDTVTLGGQLYTFKTALTASTTAFQVLIGASAATALANLTNAVNNNTADGAGSGTAGFGTLTTANTNVSAAATSGTVTTLTAKLNGTGGNSIGIANTSGATFTASGIDLTGGVAGATATIGSTTYQFVAALSTNTGGTANEVLFGANLASALQNLQDAVNLTAVHGAQGTTYSTGTVINASATAGTAAATTLGFTAKTLGTGGNNVAVSTSSQGTFANAAGGATSTLSGGTNASTVTIGNQAYTFVNAAQLGSAGAYSVLINTAASGAAAQIQATLANLASAVNAGAGSGTTYSTAAANTFATAGTATAGSGNTSTLAFTAQVNGLGTGSGATGTGNNTVSTTTGTTNGFAAATFQNGTTGDSITVGSQTYNFVTALSTNAGGTANEVVAGASVANDLSNLQAAVNAGAGAGTTYSTGTAANTSAHVTSVTSTTANFAALSTGTAGNNITTAISGGIGAFATPSFSGGSALVSVGGPAVAGDTVTVGATQYTFVNAINANSAANSVLVGAGVGATSETASLTNLAAAVSGASGAGTIFGLGTTANASATATLVANPNSGPINQIKFTALAGGTGTLASGTGNFIASSSTGGDNTFSSSLFSGGGATTNDLLTSADATAALTQIDAAVATVAQLRGTIGATVNRLQSASSVINNQTQNLTSAENDVTAADIPTTVAKLSQFSILEQTGISALAQANQQSQLILKLLQ